MTVPFRIEEKESFRAIGFVIHTTNQKKEGRKAVPAQWETFHKEHQEAVLMPLMNQEPKGLFGISVYQIDASDSRKFAHWIAVSSDAPETEELKEIIIPATTWAIFPCTMDTIGKTEVQAITKWIPKAGYQALNSGYLTGRMKAGAPDIEHYGEDGTVEVWVAVRKK